MNLAVAFLVAVVCFVADQASKWWVLDVLDLRTRFEIDVNAYLDLVLAYNRGINFGLFAGSGPEQQWALAGFATAISLVLAIWSWRTKDWRIAASCGLVIGGALGNALDRITEGAVIDFINVECCGFQNPYAFNIADTTIFVGALALALVAWREPEDDPGDATKSKTEGAGASDNAG
ncbi:MAG: signal peptidase II [Pseudomonadota bacterium]